MEDALRLNVCAVAAQVYIGSPYEHQSINNIIKLVDAGTRYGMPTLAVTGVGKEMARDARYFRLPAGSPPKWGRSSSKPTTWTRALKKSDRQLSGADRYRRGAKTAGARGAGDARRAIDQGASGVDMGRNIFQSSAPLAMLKAVKKVVHENLNAREAFQFWQEEKQEKQNERDAGGDQY